MTKLAVALVGMLLSHSAATQASPEALDSAPSSGLSLSFTTAEMTQPYISVSEGGALLYFDLLGDIYQVPMQGGKAIKLALGEGWKSRPMVSPDGSRLAFLSDRDGTISVWVSKFGSSSAPFKFASVGDANVTTATWISEFEIMSAGRGLTSVRRHGLALATDAHHNLMESISMAPSKLMASSLSASPDGRYVYLKRNGIHRLDRTTGVETVVVEEPTASEPKLMPDGARLGYVRVIEKAPTLFLKELATGKIDRTGCFLDPIATDESRPLEARYTFTPDGSAAIFGRAGHLYRCELAGKTSEIPVSADVHIDIQAPVRPHPRSVGTRSSYLRYGAFSSSTNQAAFSARGRIWLSDSPELTPRRLTSGTELEYMPAYSPSGTSILYVAVIGQNRTELRVRDLATDATRVLVSEDRLLANPTWSRDGQRIAFVSRSFGDRNGLAELRWIDLAGNTGTFGKVASSSNTDRALPVLTWDVAGTGIFYTRENEWRRQLVFQPTAGEARTMYDLGLRIWDARISPDARLIAFQGASGLFVSPMIASNAEPISLEISDLQAMRRVAEGVTHHFAWSSDHMLTWLDEDLYVSNLVDPPRRLASGNIPIAAPHTTGRIVYVGPRIITMTSQGVVEDGMIITDNNKIEYVGPRNADISLDHAQVVDLTGKTLMPGIVDVHYHLKLEDVEATFPFVQRLFAGLGYGVTTVYDPSIGTMEASILDELSQSDEFVGPTFYASGYPILGAGGTAGQKEIATYSEALQLVSGLARSGALVIKDYNQATRKQRRWLADAARKVGVGITAHEQSELRAKLSLVVDGYTGIEHDIIGDPVYDDVIRFLTASDIALTPTLGVEGEGGAYMYATIPPSNQRYACLAKAPGYMDTPAGYTSGYGYAIARNFAEILNRGGNVSVGGHGTAPGLDAHWEMWLLQLAGATPINVLRAATVNGARKLGLSDRIGALGAGMDADFLVLNSNPLEDIHSTADISRVVRRGRTVTWPANERPPGAWTARALWKDCQKWNFGLRNGR